MTPPAMLPTFTALESALAVCTSASATKRIRAFLSAADALKRAILAVDVALGSASWRPGPPKSPARALGEREPCGTFSDHAAALDAHYAEWTAGALDGFDEAVAMRGVLTLRKAVFALGQVADLVAAVHRAAPDATVALSVVIIDSEELHAARREITGALVFAGDVDRCAHDCFTSGRARGRGSFFVNRVDGPCTRILARLRNGAGNESRRKRNPT